MDTPRFSHAGLRSCLLHGHILWCFLCCCDVRDWMLGEAVVRSLGGSWIHWN